MREGKAHVQHPRQAILCHPWSSLRPPRRPQFEDLLALPVPAPFSYHRLLLQLPSPSIAYIDDEQLVCTCLLKMR